MLTTHPSDERWLAVLEGRATPTDAAERQAAELRQFFEQGLEALSAPDPQQEKRLMNALRARGAFTPAPVQPPRSLWAALQAWWGASQRPAGYGYGAAALLAFALVSVPLLQAPPADPDDAAGSPKALPRAGQGPVVAPPVPKTLQRGPTLAVADPAEASLRLQLWLSSQGVASALQPEGGGWRLTARLPAEARGELEPGLKARGVSWPADGQLDLQFTRQP